MKTDKRRLSKIIHYIFIIVISCLISSAYAKNIGIIGQIYPITEVDFLDFIQARALAMQQNGLINKLQNDMQRKAAQYRDRPTPVATVTHASESKSWLFDPSIVLDHDVRDSDGKLIAAEGARINPLIHVSLSKTLIFYDADDTKEMRWVSEIDKKLNGKDKIILVNGSTLQEEKRLSKQVYFDQSGRLIMKFNIKHVPATIVQEGDALRITEVKL